MIKKLWLAFTLATALILSASPVFALSEWSDSGFQWRASAPFIVRITDHTTGSWPARVQQAAADWSLSEAVDVKFVKNGKVDFYNGYYGATYCGWAVFYFHGGSVSHVYVYLNDSCLDSQTESFRHTVICQEMGHSLGLGDHRLDYPSSPSCMAPRLYGPSPNQEDFDELLSKYL